MEEIECNHISESDMSVLHSILVIFLSHNLYYTLLYIWQFTFLHQVFHSLWKAGKALESRKGEIQVQFKDVPGDIFRSMHYPYDILVFSLYHAFIMHILLSVLYTNPESEIGVSCITVFTLEDKIIHTSVFT